MSRRPAEQTGSPWVHAPVINAGGDELGPLAGTDSASRQPSTGTIDDDDDPGQEHEGENEASQGESRDSEETPEELLHDDEDLKGP